jgi:hypothetical protein
LENSGNRQGFDKFGKEADLKYIPIEQKMIVQLSGEFFAPLDEAPEITRSFQKWLMMWKLE